MGVQEGWVKNCIVKSFMIYFTHEILFRWSNQRGWFGRRIRQPWGRREMYKGVRWKGNILWYRRSSQPNITMHLKGTWRRVWSEHIWLTTITSADAGENSNVLSESTKRGKFVNDIWTISISTRMHLCGIRYLSAGQFFQYSHTK